MLWRLEDDAVSKSTKALIRRKQVQWMMGLLHCGAVLCEFMYLM
jgi:hypothetical protein